MFFAGCDVEINPEAVGTNLKLFVSAEMRTVRLQKHLGHIAVPKPIPSPVPLGIRENRDGAVFRPKPQKQSLPRPRQSHFGLAPGIRIFSLPVGVESQRHGSFPGRRRRESFRIEGLRALNRHSLPRFRTLVPFFHAVNFHPLPMFFNWNSLHTTLFVHPGPSMMPC